MNADKKWLNLDLLDYWITMIETTVWDLVRSFLFLVANRLRFYG